MSDIKQKADALLTKHYQESFSIRVALKHAILSTKNTIDCLREIKSKMDYTDVMKPLLNKISEQTAILKELESRI